MPVEAMWALITSLVILSLGVTLRSADIAHRLELANKEIDRVVAQFARIKNTQDKTIMGSSKLDATVMNKIYNAQREHIDNLNNIIIKMETPTKYTAYLNQDPKPKMTIGLAKAIANGDVIIK